MNTIQVLEADEMEAAIEIMTRVHGHQRDKAGLCSTLHPMRVGLAGKNHSERVVGFLHDTKEDSDGTVTCDTLINDGILPLHVDAIDALTHRNGETYNAYLDRVKKNTIALAVKLNDIADNSSPFRLRSLSLPEQERLFKKYTDARNYLLKGSSVI